jgi:hypothetical protein
MGRGFSPIWTELRGLFPKKIRAYPPPSALFRIAIVPSEDISDELLAEDVMDTIDRNLHVNVDDVDVSVVNGRVTLTGAVPSVIDVTDNLIIREPALAA